MSKATKLIASTADLRAKMLDLWERVDRGEISAQDVRVHVSLARTILDSLKVEIAAAHVNMEDIPTVSLGLVRKDRERIEGPAV